MKRQLTTGDRLLIAAAIAGVFGWYVWMEWRADAAYVSDFDQVWVAARSILEGRNPYELIGPGREFQSDFRFFYPLPAAIIAVPFGLIPLGLARVLFVAIPAGFLAYILSGGGLWRLLILASRSMTYNAHVVQWTPWLTLALLRPWAGVFLGGKPNLGLASAAALPHRVRNRTLLFAFLPVVIAFVVQPGWVADWLDALDESEHFMAYVQVPGGVLLLLAILKWRRWEARLLLALSLVPQTPGIMPALPLLLVPQRPLSLIMLSVLMFSPSIIVPFFGDFTSFKTLQPAIALVTLWAVYIPVLILVLRRPNEGPAPAWLERSTRSWPLWLRGKWAPVRAEIVPMLTERAQSESAVNGRGEM